MSTPAPARPDFPIGLDPNDPSVYRGVAAKRVFDLDKMEKKTEYQPYTVKLVQQPEHAAQFTGEQLVELLQIGQRRKAHLDAKRAIQGVDASIISKTIAPFRMFPKYAKMYQLGPDGQPVKDETGNPVVNRKAQTDAIMAFLKSQPEMWNQLVEAARESAQDEDENETEADTSDV